MKSGLYFHIPFCRSRCSYCHFVSLPFESAVAIRYANAMLRELEHYAGTGSKIGAVDSIYFGGGTPSILEPNKILEILRLCRDGFRVTDDCEISIEANPGTISKENVQIYRGGGINRVSIGAQSFSEEELSAAGRIHSPGMIIDALSQLKKNGFDNINLDLMLGLPGQTRQSWKNNLDRVVALGIPHVSVYMLDLDEPCPMRTRVEEGVVNLPEEDLISDLYLETVEFFAAHEYQQYEISNFARPGYASRHNLKYWKRNPVYGFGLGSHSFDGMTRWANTTQMDLFLAAAENGQSPRAWQEPIDADRALQETLFLGLRMAEGVDWDDIRRRFGAQKASKYEAALEEWLHKGLAEKVGVKVRLLPSGMLISNEIFQQFV